MVILKLILGLITKVLPFMKSKTAVYVVVAILALSGSGYTGWWLRDNQAEMERLEAVERVLAQTEEQMGIDREILEDSVEVQTLIEKEFIEIKGDIEYVEISDCDDLGDDWRKLYNDAAEAATATTN